MTVPLMKIGLFSKSGTVLIIIEAVTGSAPKLLVEPKLALLTGSKKMSGCLIVGVRAVIVGSAKLPGFEAGKEPFFSASLRSFLDGYIVESLKKPPDTSRAFRCTEQHHLAPSTKLDRYWQRGCGNRLS